MKRILRHVKSGISKKFKSLRINLFILELIQSILKKIIDGANGPELLLPEEVEEELKKQPPERENIFNNEPKGDTMTDREKLMKIEEALHKMRDNYRKIKKNKTGTLQMYTNKDLGDLVTKDLDSLFKYMESLEVQ